MSWLEIFLQLDMYLRHFGTISQYPNDIGARQYTKSLLSLRQKSKLVWTTMGKCVLGWNAYQVSANKEVLLD